MITLACLTLVQAQGLDTAIRPNTANTLPAGEALLRLPVGRSGLGLTEHHALFLTPYDLNVGGPRLGLEWGHSWGATHASLSPSLGLRTTGRRASARLELNLSRDLGGHQLSGQLAVDARGIRQLQITEAGVDRQLGFDRAQTQLMLLWDTPHSRVKLRVPVVDQGGKVLSSSSLAAGWVHQRDHLYLSLGVGLLLGEPTDRWTLGDYRIGWTMPYPELDLAWRF